MAGMVYDWHAIAKKYNFDPKAKCPSVLLTTKEGEAKLEVCPSCDTHGDLKSNWHTVPKGWNLAQINKDFKHSANSAQKKKAGWNQQVAKTAKS